MSKRTVNPSIKISDDLRLIARENNVKGLKNAEKSKINPSFTKGEILTSELDACYYIITGKKLSKGCDDCAMTAFKVLRNYMDFYEEKKPVIKRAGKVEVIVVHEVADSDDYTELLNMKLKDLRTLYPNIKATSVAAFVNKIKENGSSN